MPQCRSAAGLHLPTSPSSLGRWGLQSSLVYWASQYVHLLSRSTEGWYEEWFICKHFKYFFISPRKLWTRLPTSAQSDGELWVVLGFLLVIFLSYQLIRKAKYREERDDCSPTPSLASHVLTGDYFAGKLANTRANTRAQTRRPKKYPNFNTKLAWLRATKNWAATVRNYHFRKFDIFIKFFSHFLLFFGHPGQGRETREWKLGK